MAMVIFIVLSIFPPSSPFCCCQRKGRAYAHCTHTQNASDCIKLYDCVWNSHNYWTWCFQHGFFAIFSFSLTSWSPFNWSMWRFVPSCISFPVRFGSTQSKNLRCADKVHCLLLAVDFSDLAAIHRIHYPFISLGCLWSVNAANRKREYAKNSPQCVHTQNRSSTRNKNKTTKYRLTCTIYRNTEAITARMFNFIYINRITMWKTKETLEKLYTHRHRTAGGEGGCARAQMTRKRRRKKRCSYGQEKQRH